MRRALLLAGGGAGFIGPDPDPPDPDPPGEATHYANEATGSDSTGDGSEGNPWRTPGPFLDVAEPGDTLEITGTYDDVSGLVVDRSGTSGNPITLRGGTFEGTTAFFANVVGAAYVTFEDMVLTDWAQEDTGAITSTSSAHHLTFRNVSIQLAAGGDSNQHTLYMGPGCHDFLVEDCDLDGNGGSGCGINVFSSSGAPHPYGLVVQGGHIHGFNTTGSAHGRGVNIDTTDSTGPYLVEGVEFDDNRFHVRAQAGEDISVIDCFGTEAHEDNISREVGDTPGFVESGNVFT